MDAFHSAKIFGSTSSNANGTHSSTRNFPEQMNDIQKYSTVSVSTTGMEIAIQFVQHFHFQHFCSHQQNNYTLLTENS